MSDLIDRQALLRQIDIDSEGEPGYYGDTWKFIDTIKRMPSAQLATDTNVGTKLGTNLAEVGTDAVSRKAVKELAYSQIRSMYCGVALKEQRETMLRIADNVIGLLAPVTSAQPATSCSEIPNGSDDTISRQAAIDALKGCYCGGEDSCGEPWIYESHAIKAIKQLPPIQQKLLQPWEVLVAQAVLPQPEIVRCKDCKYWVPGYITDNDDFIPPKCGKWQQMVGHSSDDYCGFAERRGKQDG